MFFKFLLFQFFKISRKHAFHVNFKLNSLKVATQNFLQSTAFQTLSIGKKYLKRLMSSLKIQLKLDTHVNFKILSYLLHLHIFQDVYNVC